MASEYHPEQPRMPTASKKKESNPSPAAAKGLQTSSSATSSRLTAAGEVAAEVAIYGGVEAVSAGVGALSQASGHSGSSAVFQAKQALGSVATDTNAQVLPAVADYATVAGENLVTQVGEYTTVGSIGGDSIEAVAASTEGAAEAVVAVADSGFFEAAGEMLGAAAETTGEVLGSVAEGTVEVIGGILGGLLS